MEEGVYMTRRDLDRAEIFSRVKRKEMSQVQAAKEIGLSLRQTQRLYHAFKEQGAESVPSKRKGKPSNNQLPPMVKARVLELVTCELYVGFGPTFMSEKLQSRHQIKISRETTRRLMIESGVWDQRKKKCPVIHQQRERRHCFGELVQVDGSPHAWFEDRGEPCTLLVYIDDATGRTYCKFVEAETTVSYMLATREYINKFGRPRAFYTDKYSTFRVNAKNSTKRDSLTQFGRALQELEIELLYANSPQAKGRVERANKTMQDRLVKELRLHQISTIEEANLFLERFLDEYNNRFTVPAKSERDVHRPAPIEDELNQIFCLKYQRKVSKVLEIQHKNVIYQLIPTKRMGDLRREYVTVSESFEGAIIKISYKCASVEFKKYAFQHSYGRDVDLKETERFLRPSRKPSTPGYNHPWKQQGRAEAKRRQYMSL